MELYDEKFSPKDILKMFIQEIELGSALLPLPEQFIEHVKSEGIDDDPETSMTFFYMGFTTSAGKHHRFLMTALEAMQIQLAVTEFMQGTIDRLGEGT